MRDSILSYIEKLKIDRRKHRKILWLFAALAMMVAGTVFWRMRLIGITKTASPMCGISEHVHTDECIVSKILICGYEDETLDPDDGLGAEDNELAAQPKCDFEVHKHSEVCIGLDGSFICGYADYVIHTHDAYCYDNYGNLTCQLIEVEEHFHDDSCYEENTVYLCEDGLLSETPLHIHGDTCYTTETTLICELPEDENHIHGEGCYIETNVLTCGISDELSQQHIHNEFCPTTTERVLICGKPEVIFHLHNNECYDMNGSLICGMLEVDEHQHDDYCRNAYGSILLSNDINNGTSKGQLNCTFTVHQHDASCYDFDGNVICGISDFIVHRHDADCYDDFGGLICPLPETIEHIHTPDCFTEFGAWSCGLEEGELVVVHTHDDSCYDEDNVLICTIPETELHIHGESCFLDGGRTVICGLSEAVPHIHDSGCYDENGVLICGMNLTFAHQHDDSCFINNNVDDMGSDAFEALPGDEIPKHVHTDECYEIIYGCGLPVHFHSIMCYADINADIETLEYWKATLPNNTSEYVDENVVNVALSQLGYKESKRNFTLDDHGVRRGYTRYGQWYGNAYGEWNSMFVAFCLNYGGITQNEIPYNSGAYAWTVQLKQAELLREAGEDYESVPGDIVFFDTDADGVADRVGIVSQVNDNGFVTIEGDYCDDGISEPYIPDDIIQSVVHSEHDDDVVNLDNQIIPGIICDNFEFDDYSVQLLGSFDEVLEHDVVLQEPQVSYVWDDDNIPTHYVAEVNHYYADGNIVGYVRLAEELDESLDDESALLYSFGKVYVPYEGDYDKLDPNRKYALVNVDNNGAKKALYIGSDDTFTGVPATIGGEQSTVNNATKWQLVENTNGFFVKVSGEDKYIAFNKNTQQIELITNAQIWSGDPYAPNFLCESLSGNSAKLTIRWTNTANKQYLYFDSSTNHFVCSDNSSELTLSFVDGSSFDGYSSDVLPYSRDLYISVGGNYLTNTYVQGTPPQTTTVYSPASVDKNSAANAPEWLINNHYGSMFNLITEIDGQRYYLVSNSDNELVIRKQGDTAGCQENFQAVVDNDITAFKVYGSSYYLNIDDNNVPMLSTSPAKVQLAQASNIWWSRPYDEAKHTNDNEGFAVALIIGDSDRVLICNPNTVPTGAAGTPSYLASTTPTTTMVYNQLQEPGKYTKWTVHTRAIDDNNGTHYYEISNDGQYINLDLEMEKYIDENDNTEKERPKSGFVHLGSACDLVFEQADNGYRIHRRWWDRNYLIWDGEKFTDNYVTTGEIKNYGNQAILNFYDSTTGALIQPTIDEKGNVVLPDGDYIIVINTNIAVSIGGADNNDILKDARLGSRELKDKDLWTFPKIKTEANANEQHNGKPKFDDYDYRIINATGAYLEPYGGMDTINPSKPVKFGAWNSKSAFVPYEWNGISGMLIMSKNDTAVDSPYYLVRKNNGTYEWKLFDDIPSDYDPVNLDENIKKKIAEAGGFFQLYYKSEEEDNEKEDHVYSIVSGGASSPSRDPNTPVDIVLKAGDKVTIAVVNGESKDGDYRSIDDSNIKIYRLNADGTPGELISTTNDIVDCGYRNNTRGGFPYYNENNYRLDALREGKVQIQITDINDENPVYINLTILPEDVSDALYYEELKKTCTGKYYPPYSSDSDYKDKEDRQKHSKRYYHLDVEIMADFDLNIYRPDGTVRHVDLDPSKIKVKDVYATVYNTAALINDGYRWNENYIFNRDNSGRLVLDHLLQTYQNPMGADRVNKGADFAIGAFWLKDSAGYLVFNENYMSEYDPNNPNLVASSIVLHDGKQYAVDLDKVYTDYKFINPHETVYSSTAFPNPASKPVMSYDVHYNPGKIQDNGQYEFLTAGWGWLELYDGDTTVLHATVEYEYNGKTYTCTQDVTRLICDTTNICPSGYSCDLPIQGFDIDVFMGDADQFDSTEFVKIDQYGERVPGAEFIFYCNAGSNYSNRSNMVRKASDENGVFHFTYDDVLAARNWLGLTDEQLNDIIGEARPGSDDYTNAPLTMSQLRKFLGDYFVIEEDVVPNGYRRVGEEIRMHFIGSNEGVADNTSSNIFVICENTVECGVHTDPNAFINAPTVLESLDGYHNYDYIVDEDDPNTPATKKTKGTLYAVVAKRNGVAPDATELDRSLGFEYWTPIWGNLFYGYNYMDLSGGDNLEAVKKMIEMHERGEIPADQGVYKFELDEFNMDAATVSAKNLPGDVKTYVAYVNNNVLPGLAKGSDEYKQAIKSLEYIILYFYVPENEPNNLVRIKNFLVSDDNSGNQKKFRISWSATVHIPNIENRLFFHKTDADGHAVNGANFALYHAGDPTENPAELQAVQSLAKGDYNDIFTNGYYYDKYNPSWHCYLGDIVAFNTDKDKPNYKAIGNCIIYHDGKAEKGKFGIDYSSWGANEEGGYVTKAGAGQIQIYDENYNPFSKDGNSTLVIVPASKNIGTERQVYVGYTHSGSSNENDFTINEKECSVVAEDGTGHFGKIENGTYILREIKPPSGFDVNNKAQTLVMVNEAGVFANGGEVDDGVSVLNGAGYLVSTLQSHASRGTINETLRWIYSALRINNTDTFAGFYDGVNDRNDSRAIRNAVTSWNLAKPSTEKYTFTDGTEIVRQSWAMNPSYLYNRVVFNNVDGEVPASCEDPWGSFGIVGTPMGREACCDISLDDVRDLFARGDCKFTFVYSGNPTTWFNSGNPLAVINADKDKANWDKGLSIIPKELGNGQYEATVELDEILKAYGDITADNISSFVIQIATGKFELYSAKFTIPTNKAEDVTATIPTTYADNVAGNYTRSAANSFMDSVTVEQYCPNGLNEIKDGVQYGKTVTTEYYSNTCGRNRPVNIVLPANYSKDKQYPVMYVLHGIFCNETTMMYSWKTHTIIQNMIADGTAEEMILVFPNIYASTDPNQQPNFDLDSVKPYDNFVNDLLNDLMPYMASNYSIATGKDNTAILGFSMGGREALAIGFMHPEMFGYVGAIAPAPGLTPGEDCAMKHPGMFAESELVFKSEKPYLLMIGAGDKDGTVGSFPKSYHNILNANVTQHIWYEIPDSDHADPAIASVTYNFAKYAFKASDDPDTPDNPNIPNIPDNPNSANSQTVVPTANGLQDALVTYLEYQPLVISADYNKWQDGNYKYAAPYNLQGRAARSLFNYETNLHLDAQNYYNLPEKLRLYDYPAFTLNGTTYYGSEARKDSNGNVISNDGSRTLRLTTDYGWSSLSIYQDAVWADLYRQAHPNEAHTQYTSYVKNGIPTELSQLYSNSTFVQVVDKISTYLTIVKRGDTNANKDIDTADQYLDGAVFVMYHEEEIPLSDGSTKKIRNYYTYDADKGVIGDIEYEPNYKANGVLYPKAYRFVTGSDGVGAVLISFAKSGTYYLEEIKAPSPYGVIGTLRIEVELSANPGQAPKITIYDADSDNPVPHNAVRIFEDVNSEVYQKYKEYFKHDTQAAQYVVELLDPKNYRLEINKVDGSNSTPLEDAKFIVYKEVNGIKYYYKEYNLDGSIDITNNRSEAKIFTTEYEKTTLRCGGQLRSLHLTNRYGVFIDPETKLCYSANGALYKGPTTGIIQTDETFDVILGAEDRELYVTNKSVQENIYMDINTPNKYYKLDKDANGVISLSEYKPNGNETITHSRSYIAIDGLANTDTETYYIEEIKPPIGYQPLSTRIEVDFKQRNGDQRIPTVKVENKTLGNGYVTAITRNDLDIDGDGIADPNTVVGYRFTIENSAGYELPETGGIGTHYYTFGGLLLIVIPLVYGFVRRRRERGAEE